MTTDLSQSHNIADQRPGCQRRATPRLHQDSQTVSLDEETSAISVLLALLTFAVVEAAETKPAEQTQETPNVFIIYSDDHGYTDLGVFGTSVVKTSASHCRKS